MNNNRPDPAGVAGVCFALAGVIVIVSQVVELVQRWVT